MIYLEEKLNLKPASPETLDTFVEFTRDELLPLCQPMGCRVAAAWFSNVELFSRVTQLLEFKDMGAFAEFYSKTQQKPWKEYEKRLNELAPERHLRLLEPLGPVSPEVLNEAAEQSRQSPLGAYFLAILEVAPDKMPTFIQGLNSSAGTLPIIASWRPVTGNRNEVIDLWKGAIPLSGYQPADDRTRQFFRGLRELAPRERVIPVIPLPYSPLL